MGGPRRRALFPGHRAAARRRGPALLAAAAVLAAACVSDRRLAPVEEAGRPAAPERSVHVVRVGDTLFSIAFRYGMDHRELARLNGIAPPWTIRPGQRIKLAGTRPRGLPAGDRGAAPPAPAEPVPARSEGVGPEGPERRSRERPPNRAAPAPRRWRWPVEGQLVRGFSTGAVPSKGIDIRARPGAPVRAAAAGRVVYAGTGLRGYGLLVIVRHDERYLSAYAHNRRALVAEGAAVAAGAVIAELEGPDDAPGVCHFEVRVDGEPVDPLTLLPRS